MNVEDCYQELGVGPEASDADVKAAWRRLAARWHPDRNGSPQALLRIQRINRALEEIRRARGGGAAAEPSTDATPFDMEDTVHLTLEEVASGCVRELRGEILEDCVDCAGTGVHAQPAPCADCHGTGRARQALWFSWMTPPAECSACSGQGSLRHGCATCATTGKAAPRKYRCRVQVPAGVRADDVLDVSAQVEGRQRKHRLALRVRIALREHTTFSVRSDGTLACELAVDGFAWTANRWIEVPTVRGTQQMRLRRGTLNYRVKGGGLPWLEAGAAADCIVSVVPRFPEEFSPAQEALIDQLMASNS
jgi:molecular chaperone DnaJ